VSQSARDEIPTFWVSKNDIHVAIRSLRSSIPEPYKMLYDLTAIDERGRMHRDGQPPSDFTVV
jgi:NADH-quinone oxidoreductase subunit C/D